MADDTTTQQQQDAAAQDADAAAEAAATANDPVAALQEENAKLKDQLLRALADAENTRRRAERDKADMQKYAITGFARDLLNVADNLRRALESEPTDLGAESDSVKALVEGVEITERELLSIMERNGIRKIEPLGERFDHNYHQAMFEMDAPDQPAGTVVQLLQPGYVIHDRLLRPALVGVAKAGATPSAPGETLDTTA